MNGKELVNMLQGWGDFVIIPSAAREPEAKRRLHICDMCPERKGTRCGACGCPLIAKARSDSGCPKDKW